ncbi:translation initiation factor IF-3 [Patescibacteria group bacterium]|nr:translation initiation factor IF-3 [Patescibacteria group bacterium]
MCIKFLLQGPLDKIKTKNIYKRKYYKRKQEVRTRINQWIRITPIQLINEKGENIGTIETSKALEMAKEEGLDLIEIAPNAKPPVCRIMDYGKFQYQKSRKEKIQKSKQKKTEIKGVRISPRIGQHDLNFKAKQAEKFLNQGHKVKIEMILKGREKGLLDIAREKLNKFIEIIDLETVFEQEIKRQPRGLFVIITKDKKQ